MGDFTDQKQRSSEFLDFFTSHGHPLQKSGFGLTDDYIIVI